MISYINEAKYYVSGTDKQLTIIPTKSGVTYPTFHNSDLEKVTLDRAICKETDMVFGSVNSAVLTMTVRSSCDSLVGATLTVSQKLDNDAGLQIGIFKVKEDTKTADITKRNITAYDALYEVMTADVTSWWEGLFPTATTSKTIKQIRDSFAAHFGLSQKSQTLANDSLSVIKPVSGQLDGAFILRHLGQINGAFPVINYIGQLEWKVLGGSVKTIYNNSIQQGAKFKTYESRGITQLKIRETEDDIGVAVGTSGHMYTLTGNILTLGLSSAQKTSAGNALLNVIKNKPYTPCDFKMVGNPCIEPGDRITVSDGSTTVDTIVMQSNLTLGQAMVENVVAEGNQVRSSTANSTAEQIEKLRQRTLELRQTIEGIEAEIADITSDYALKTEVQAVAGQVALKVSKSDGTSSSKAQWTIDATNGVTIDTHDTANGFTVKANGTEVLAVNKNGLNVTGNGTFTGNVGSAGLTTVNGNDRTEVKAGEIDFYRNNVLSGKLTPSAFQYGLDNEEQFAKLNLNGLSVNDYRNGEHHGMDVDSIGFAVGAEYGGDTENAYVVSYEMGLRFNGEYAFKADENGIQASNLACGHATIGSNWSTGGTISFGKTFPSVPKVVATYSQASWVSGQIGAIKIRNVTKTGFEASISGTWEGSVGIDWIAMC